MRKFVLAILFGAACAVCAAEKFPAVHTVSEDSQPARGHIQGGCASEDAFFLAYQKGIYKIDRDGKVIKHVNAVRHTGDICFYKGKVYSAVAYYDKARKGKGAIKEYDTDLNELRTYELEFASDGITCMDGMLSFGIGPNPQKLHRGNRIAKMPVDFSGKPEIFNIDHGYRTHFGPQTITNDGKNIIVSFYCPEKEGDAMAFFDSELKLVKTLKFEASMGFDVVPWLSKKDDLVFFRLREFGKGGAKKRRIDFHKYQNGKMVNVTSHPENKK